MKLTLFKKVFKCKTCGKTFDVYDLAPETYGEFVLCASDGQLAYLNALTDPVFDEVRSMVKNLKALQTKSPNQKTDAAFAVFGVSCDPAKDGSTFQMRPPYLCPHCKSDQTTFVKEPEPFERLEVDIPHVTHEYWSRLNITARELAILSELARKRLL